MARTAVTRRHVIGNNAIRLPGNSNLNLSTCYAEINSAVDPSTQQLAFAFWFYLEHTGSSTDWNYNISILSQLDNSGTGRSIVVSNINTGKIASSLGGNASNRNSGFIPLVNTWYHLVLNSNPTGPSFQFFIDKSARATVTGGNAIESTTGAYRFGANKGTVRSFEGYIMKPRVFIGNLTQAQVTALYDADVTTGLTEAFHFPINDGTTGDRDVSGNGRVLTLANGTSLSGSVLRFPDRQAASGRLLATSRSVV